MNWKSKCEKIAKELNDVFIKFFPGEPVVTPPWPAQDWVTVGAVSVRLVQNISDEDSYILIKCRGSSFPASMETSFPVDFGSDSIVWFVRNFWEEAE